MDLTFQQKAVAEVDQFLGKTGMSESYLGKRAANNSGAVASLRRGKITLKTAEKLLAFIREQQR